MSLPITPLLFNGFLETIYMVFISGLITAIVGVPLGAIIFATDRGPILYNLVLNKFVSWIVNAVRSIPFIILMVAIIPFTRIVVGTSIGINAAIVPLAIGAIPFYARIVANALNEVPFGLTEAAQSMGASSNQIMIKVLIPESMPSLINGFTLAIITLIGYSAMAGAVGGGGLGDIAIRYGYQRFNIGIMFATVVILIVLVQLIQILGDFFAKKCDKS